MPPTPRVSSVLASFASGLSWGDVPDDVAHQARRCLIDWMGCTLAGSADAGSRRVQQTAGTLGASAVGTARIVGTSSRTSAPFAALANGFAAHVLDFDDTFNPGDTTVHGSAHLWAALAASSELAPVTGREAVLSFIAGFEVQTRVAVAAGRGQYDAGWHVTGTVGHIGAAVSVARQLRLTQDQTLVAIGTGATQAAGMKVVYGSMGKALHPGKAAMDGLLSAYLARDGFTSSTEPIEGHRGFFHLFSPAPSPEKAVEGLGERWLLTGNGFKPYACGSLTHPATQALLELREQHHLEVADVESVHAFVHDYVLTTTGNPRPQTGLEGKFSIYHVLAVALVDGAALEAQFTDERVSDPSLRDVRALVTVDHDPEQDKDSAHVRVRLRDGRSLDRAVAHNLGTPGAPMTDAQLEGKFLALAAPILGDRRAKGLAEACWGVTELPDLRGVLDLAIPASTSPGR